MADEVPDDEAQVSLGTLIDATETELFITVICVDTIRESRIVDFTRT